VGAGGGLGETAVVLPCATCRMSLSYDFLPLRTMRLILLRRFPMDRHGPYRNRFPDDRERERRGRGRQGEGERATGNMR
jgi:hypothetical protein